MPVPSNPDVLLDVRDLRVHYSLRRPHPFAAAPKVYAVDGISFQVRRGSAFGIVGESGCGKSTTALALMQLIQSTGGHATLDGIDLLGARGQAQAAMRRRVQMIFQDPYSSLDPRQRVEGIIAKQRDQPYRSGRTGDWLKIKCVRSESFMIVGYEASAAARGGIGSLLLAGKRGYDWIYVGAVGTGFNGNDAAILRTALEKLRTNTPTVPLKGKNLVFTQPTLIAEIEFRGWSNDGKLRRASYKGLREVQDNAAVFDMSDREP